MKKEDDYNEEENDEEDDEENEDDFDEVILKINGREVFFNIKENLEIVDVSEGQSKVAAWMGYWSAIWSSAEAEKIECEAHYRYWKASLGKKIVDKNPKLAEWKVRQLIESNKQFLKYKKALATANKNTIIAKGHFESFRIKGNALQSKGAQMRAEMEATGMTTKIKDKEENKDKKIRSMKRTFKKNK